MLLVPPNSDKKQKLIFFIMQIGVVNDHLHYPSPKKTTVLFSRVGRGGSLFMVF